MYNMDEEQTSLKELATDIYDSLNRIDSLDEIPITIWAFKFIKGKNGPITFLSLMQIPVDNLE